VNLAKCRAAVGLYCILHEKACWQSRYVIELTDELHGEIPGMFYALAGLELTGFSLKSAAIPKRSDEDLIKPARNMSGG
jgi:hypothetical protein